MIQRDEIFDDDVDELLTSFDRLFTPDYVALLERSPLLRRLPYWTSALLIGLGVHLMMRLLSAFDKDFSSSWSHYFLPLMITAGLSFITSAHHTLRESLPSIVDLLAHTDQLRVLRKDLRFMFKSSSQRGTCLVLGAMIVLIHLLLRRTESLPAVFQNTPIWLFLVSQFTLALLGVVGGWGLWLALSFLRLTHHIGKFSILKVNPAFPHTTVGLQRLSRVAATFSLYFSIELVLLLIAALSIPWQGEKDIVVATVYSWLFAFIPFTLFLFIHPQLLLRGIVVREKERELAIIENYIRRFQSIDGQSSPDFDAVIKCMDVHQRILNTRNAVIGMSGITKLVSLLGVQLPFLIDLMIRYDITIGSIWLKLRSLVLP